MNVEVDAAAPVRGGGVIVIAAPISVVWRVLTRIEGWASWQSDVTEAVVRGPVQEGAEFRWKAGGISFRSKIHTMSEGKLFGWTGKTFGASAIHNWTFVEQGEGTSVTVAESLDGPLPRLARGFFQKNLDQGIRKNLEELRSACEHPVTR